jgi:pseudoazurin
MYKNKAIVIAVIIAIVAIFVVVAATSVFDHDSKERYGDVSAPQSEATLDDESAVAPAAVMDETTEPLAQNDAGGINETVTEHMEDASEAVPETVVEDAIVDVVPEPAEESQPAAGSAIHIVTAQGLKYEPMVIKIQPGDTVAWENMPTHDTQSIEGLIPQGAEAWHSAMGVNYQRTFTVEGIYVYKCTPHIGAGMGGAIIVGKPVNLAAIIAADAKGAEGRLARKAIAEAQAM